MKNKPKLLYYATSYAVTANQLYHPFKYSKWLRYGKDLGKSGSMNLCAQVLKYLFYLVVKDIIENKITFKCPPVSKAVIEMGNVSGEEFVKARQNGAFQDVDFLVSNFTGYKLNLRVTNRYGSWTKRIYVSSKYRDKIVELTNKGETW